MTKVVGIQFLSGLKVYDFKIGDREVDINDYVLVETSQGEEIGKVVYKEKEVKEKDEKTPLKEVRKVLTDSDKEKLKGHRRRGAEMLPRFQEMVERYKLDMKPVMVDFTLDGEKAMFYFTSEGRVDFRDLVKDLARTFRTQVKMRQIGARDEAKVYGGYGMCGRPICCKNFLISSANITMDMARDQYNSGVKASKVSGICGRLMCCLAFEGKEKEKK